MSLTEHAAPAAGSGQDPAEPVPTAAMVSGVGTSTALGFLLFVWCAGIATVVLSWPTLRHPVPVVLAMAWMLVGLVAVTRPGASVPFATALVIASVPGVASAAALVQLDAVPVGQVWLVQMGGNLAGLLAVRGRVALACAALAVQLVVVAVWAVPRDLLGGAAAMIVLPVAATMVGVAWNRILERGIAATMAYRQAHVRSAVERAATQLATERATARLRQITDLARPLLEQLAAGRPADPGLREDCRIAEATVRDRVRAPGLAVEPVGSACVRARRRGIEVLLLDDGDEGRPVPQQTLAEVAAAVELARSGRVTVRVNPPGRRVAVTVLVDEGQQGGEATTRLELGVP